MYQTDHKITHGSAGTAPKIERIDFRPHPRPWLQQVTASMVQGPATRPAGSFLNTIVSRWNGRFTPANVERSATMGRMAEDFNLLPEWTQADVPIIIDAPTPGSGNMGPVQSYTPYPTQAAAAASVAATTQSSPGFFDSLWNKIGGSVTNAAATQINRAAYNATDPRFNNPLFPARTLVAGMDNTTVLLGGLAAAAALYLVMKKR
jgi:hypothetical protein